MDPRCGSDLMLVLQGWFDESGKLADSDYVVFAGFIGKPASWNEFSFQWTKRLRAGARKVPYLHTVDAMSLRGAIWKNWNSRDRDTLLIDLAKILHAHVPHGIVAHCVVNDFRVHTILKEKLGNPHYAAFEACMMGLLEYSRSGRDDLHIITDDEEKYGVECYKLLNKLKIRHPKVRNLISGFCLNDDRKFPPLQAADLWSYFHRQELVRLKNTPNEPQHPVYAALASLFGKPKNEYLEYDLTKGGIGTGKIVKAKGLKFA